MCLTIYQSFTRKENNENYQVDATDILFKRLKVYSGTLERQIKLNLIWPKCRVIRIKQDESIHTWKIAISTKNTTKLEQLTLVDNFEFTPDVQTCTKIKITL